MFVKLLQEAVKSAEERSKGCGGGTVQDEAVEDQLLRLRKVSSQTFIHIWC